MQTSSRPQVRPEPLCSIERSLQFLSDRWSFCILREALLFRVTRFADFQSILGIAPNVLSNRLDTLVKAGVLTKRAYQEPGARKRFSYHATPAGEELVVALAALQQWGDEHNAPRKGPTLARRSPAGKPVRVAFLDDDNKALPVSEVAFIKTDAYPK
jgi:DNA-binding HxlR family transcriptional regulator